MPVWCQDLIAALLLTGVVLAYHAATGFPRLHDFQGDNDSLLRLVQIRALLDGQGWFDLQQYRMGLDGGFALHWSRLVDLPIAGLIAVGGALGLDRASAEAFAMTAWPTILFALALFMIVDTARRLGGEKAILPALILGTSALHFTAEFAPGAIDHHNIQLVLVLAMLNRMAGRPMSATNGAAAGVLGALSIAIGMETAPYVAIAGAGAGLLLLAHGAAAARFATGFGAAFVGATALAFQALVAPSEWPRASCDALSVFQLSVAAAGGIGLCLAVLAAGSGGVLRRAAALGVLGAGVALLVVIAFPQCLQGPYGDLDPRMRELWLDHVAEARSFLALMATRPHAIAAHYVTPVIALGALGFMLFRGGPRPSLLLVGAMLAMAFAVSLWQVRGSTFSVPLATIVLAIALGLVGAHARTKGRLAAALMLAGGWLVATNAAWAVAGGMSEAARSGHGLAGANDESSACYARADYAKLAQLPPGTVLAVSNLGASILAHTPHRALAGPYHRNQAGNLAMLDANMSTPDEARGIVLANGIDYVAVCPGNRETAVLAGRAPGGLIDVLARGEVPDWLESQPAGEGDVGLKVFVVAGQQ